MANLHGRDILATTVVQTCVRYDESERCRFCAIQSSLKSGATIAVTTPATLAEVAEAEMRLDGVRQMAMTTGTSHCRDRGAKHRACCVAAVKAAVPQLEIQVQREPPADCARSPTCTTRLPARSASMSNRWMTRCGAAGCRASGRYRWTIPRSVA